MAIRKNIDFSLCVEALHILNFLNHILNNVEFLTVRATFLKSPSYVNLWQIFVLL